MIATGLRDFGLGTDGGVDFRCASELTGDNQEGAFVESALVEVFDERRDGLVVGGDAPAGVVEDVAVDRVAVPVVGAVFGNAFGGVGLFPDHRDESTSGFDEAPRHETALTECVHAISLANGGGFFGKIECFADLLAGKHGHCALRELIHGAHEAASVKVTADGIHAFKEGHPVIEASGHVAADAEIIDLELWGARIAADNERGRTRSQVGGPDCEHVNPGSTAIGSEDTHGHTVAGFSLEDAVDDGRDGGRVVHGAGGGGRDSSCHEAFMATAVIGEVVVNGADDVELVRYFCLKGHEFTDLDARDIRGDWLEDASVLGGSVGFHVVHLHVRRTAWEPDEDDGSV